MFEVVNSWLIDMYVYLMSVIKDVLYYLKKNAKRALVTETGDTNFISILIILAVVVVAAGVFIKYQNSILEKVNETVNKFKGEDSFGAKDFGG